MAKIAWTPKRVETIVAAFGGPTALAKALDHDHHTTVAAWVRTGKIPRWHILNIKAAAESKGVPLPDWFLKAA